MELGPCWCNRTFRAFSLSSPFNLITHNVVLCSMVRAVEFLIRGETKSNVGMSKWCRLILTKIFFPPFGCFFLFFHTQFKVH